MQRPVRGDRRQPAGSRRGPARWTFYEVGLMIVSALMIIFPLYAEAYRWAVPRIAPAAPRAQEATPPPTEVLPGPLADPGAPAADTAVPQPDAARETNTPVIETATSGPTDTTGPLPPSATTAPPTSTVDPGLPTSTTAPVTNTPVQPSSTVDPNLPTNTSVPPTVTATTDPAATTTATIDPAATATFTALPATATVTLTPSQTPTLIVGQPRLSLSKSASVSRAAIGDSYSYSISAFTDSAASTALTVRDDINGALEVTGTSATNGSCSVSGNTVTCALNARSGQPASAVINVRVRSSAAPGASIANQASVRDSSNNTAASEQVLVQIGGTVVGPTRTPGSGGGSDTATPVIATATLLPGGQLPTATTAAGGGNSGGGNSGGGSSGGGNSGGGQESTPLPDPGVLILPPTPNSGGVLPPTPVTGAGSGGAGGGQPQATRVRTARPQASRAPVAPLTPSTTVTREPTSGLFFRVASDRGSAFRDQEVTYVLALVNDRPGEPLRDVVLSAALPPNLIASRATISNNARPAGASDPQLTDGRLRVGISELKQGERIEVQVLARVAADAPVGSRVVVQSELTYGGLQLPIYSNLVSLQIVGSPAVVEPPATATPSATLRPTTTATGVAASVTVRPGSPYPAPAGTTATPTAPAQAAGTTPPPVPVQPIGQLPSTSTGVPLAGLALLGGTVLTRTLRIHRAKTRV